MKNVLVGIGIILFLSGCWDSGKWVKQDWQWEQYEKDRNECYYYAEANQSLGFRIAKSYDAASLYRSKAFAQCMEGRGYEWEYNKK